MHVASDEMRRCFGGQFVNCPYGGSIKLHPNPFPERNAVPFRRTGDACPYGVFLSCAANRTKFGIVSAACLCLPPGGRGTAKRWKEPARRKIKGIFIVTHSPPPAFGGSPLPEGASRQGSAAPKPSIRVDRITVGAIHESPANERNAASFRRREPICKQMRPRPSEVMSNRIYPSVLGVAV